MHGEVAPGYAIGAAALLPSSNARTARSFELLAEPLRREVKVHCYRMLGSVHDAEDVTQDSFLRAWQAFPRYDDSGSFRAWLYRIATNACLNLLADRKRRRRHLPDQLAKASRLPIDGATIDGPDSEIAWLEPYPDAFLEGIADTAPNAETRYSTRESVRLAFVAVIQKLPPRQRAMLLLSDVLGWSAVDIAQLLDSTVPAVNSGLQRARATLAAQKPALQLSTPPVGARQQRLLERYVAAWESFDLEGFIALLSDEARLVMPPFPQWFVGPEAIRAFNRNVWRSFAAYRLISTSANGQPAFGLYARVRTEGPWAAHSLQLLSFGGDDRIEALTFFLRPDGPRLFPSFGLPLELGH
jgi:RNA polymerase sigma-70 factor (ECF subfamily)